MPKRNARRSDDDVILCGGLALAGGIPEWVHLLPAGKIATADNRGPFTLDADAKDVIAASLKASPDGKLPIDINHATDLAAAAGGPSPAQGWIEEIEQRADGLWGRVAWTEAGKALLADRAYRFLSPVILAAKATGRIAAVLRASLTNNPNLIGLTPILNQSEGDEGMDFLKQLLAALGLPETGDEKAALAAVTALKTGASAHAAEIARIAKAAKAKDGADLAAVLNAVETLAKGTVPETAVEALRTELNAAVTELDAVKQAIAREKAESFVDAMIAAGKPGVKPLRDHYIARHMADAAAVEKELNAQISLTAKGMPTAAPPGTGVELNQAEAEAAKLLGIKPEDYAKTRNAEKESR